MRTTLNGSNLIAGEESAQGSSVFRSIDPRTGSAGTVDVHEATADEIDAAATAATAAFRELRAWPSARRAELLRAIADELDAIADELIAVTDRETGLGASPRLTGELARTTGQLRAFGQLLDDGWYVEAIIDTATEAHPDVRRMLVPLGPVAVFGASNFPLAFSVAGGDTASALAAGCPVVVKTHSSHPETSELTARAVVTALERMAAPAGTFSLIHGSGAVVGTALALHPAIKAVGFTGSLGAGRALHDLAASRPEPIPVYAEMGSLNPLFVTTRALAARAEEIAEGFVGSMTLGNGQFCTKPGLAFASGPFEEHVAARLAGVPSSPLLNPRIRDAFVDGVREPRAFPASRRSCERARPTTPPWGARPVSSVPTSIRSSPHPRCPRSTSDRFR